MVSLEIHNMALELVDTNLLHFIEIVTKQVDKGLPVDVVYLYFSKAFDKVSQSSNP